MRILFIVKAKTEYTNSYSTVSGGLFNSAQFVVGMLNKNNINSTVVEVQDNNCIDKEVTLFNPDLVIIEALWVVPEKFQELKALHPNVRWVIRLHSHIPFLANEGVAIEWLKKYTKYSNVFVAVNYYQTKESLERILNKVVLYLPNYYPISKPVNILNTYPESELHIGCFGAIRPLKNQLIQALAAIEFARQTKKTLYFHINSSRVENKGEEVLKNLRSLFDGTQNYLIEHTWHSHTEFLDIVRTMDLGMQVSLSETYNIVSADFVNQEVPIVTSHEIEFVNKHSQASTKDITDTINAMYYSLKYPRISTWSNKRLLKRNSKRALQQWISTTNQFNF